MAYEKDLSIGEGIKISQRGGGLNLNIILIDSEGDSCTFIIKENGRKIYEGKIMVDEDNYIPVGTSKNVHMSLGEPQKPKKTVKANLIAPRCYDFNKIERDYSQRSYSQGASSPFLD